MGTTTSRKFEDTKTHCSKCGKLHDSGGNELRYRALHFGTWVKHRLDLCYMCYCNWMSKEHPELCEVRTPSASVAATRDDISPRQENAIRHLEG